MLLLNQWPWEYFMLCLSNWQYKLPPFCVVRLLFRLQLECIVMDCRCYTTLYCDVSTYVTRTVRDIFSYFVSWLCFWIIRWEVTILDREDGTTDV